MSQFTRAMSQLSPELRHEVERITRLRGRFAVAYQMKRELAAISGIPLNETREQFIHRNMSALTTSKLRTPPGSIRPAQLTGQNRKYELEYESAQKNGVRMRSTLLEYINSRRMTDGLTVVTEEELNPVRPGLRFKMQGERKAEILVFGDIIADSTSSATNFLAQLRRFDGVDEVTVRINSDGGDPYQAVAMYNALREFPAQIRTVNEGTAASAASLLFMAGDVRVMRPGSQLMIHEPEVGIAGRAEQLRTAADAVEQTRDSVAAIYANRSGNHVQSVLEWMKVETYFNPEEAVRRGFATAAT
ncbi:head maturation protease, ClpP-related [Planctomicrobium sp. SH668]|uniref:head maturation protease, ClpP-related n=1 Tax=Planctomicrobium sp. SH668 TaxID=3448126 RepID=UPI003F5C0221